jgi:hypothetical protein
MGRFFLCLLLADLLVAWPLLLVVGFVDLPVEDEVFFAGAAALPLEPDLAGVVALCWAVSACIRAAADSSGSSTVAANKTEMVHQRFRFPPALEAGSERYATALIKRNSSYESMLKHPHRAGKLCMRIQTVNEYEFVVPHALSCLYFRRPS